MERIVTQTRFAKTELPRAKRVAAYARVSSGKDAMLHSLSAQVSYYSKLIQNHSGWEYAGVYADEALTGTKDTRENFQRLLADCRNGKIDMILTKSVSRFARNTLTLLETVRELKSLGVDVFFEEQNIHTASSEGELMLTILASYAQEESLSASENQKWRIRQQFQEGKITNVRRFFGYKVMGSTLVPDEATAPIVREIFERAVSGESFGSIARDLNDRGITGVNGGKWKSARISDLLGNEKYCGNALLQKTFRNNHIDKKECRNKGELPRYYAEDTHEGIIDEELFCAVGEILKVNAARKAECAPCKITCFTGLITCAGCGKHYRRKVTKTSPVWICSTYNTQGKKYCPSKAIPEPTLMALADEVGAFGKITAITAEKDNTLIFSLENGETIVKRWKDRSRSESWTPEMRAAVGKKTKERSKQNGNN